jgi:hypothetical protein
LTAADHAELRRRHYTTDRVSRTVDQRRDDLREIVLVVHLRLDQERRDAEGQ